MPVSYANAAGIFVSQTPLTRPSVTSSDYTQNLATWLAAAKDLMTITDINLSQAWEETSIPLKLDLAAGWLPVSRKFPASMKVDFNMVVQEKDLTASPAFGLPGWFFQNRSNTEYPIGAFIYMSEDKATRLKYAGYVGNWSIQQTSTSIPTTGIIVCGFTMTPYSNVKYTTISLEGDD